MADQVPVFKLEQLSTTAALLRAQIAVDAAITRDAAQPAGLEPSIADLLVRLSVATNNSLRGVEIGRQLMVSPARVSRLVDRAETQGLVERLPDPVDRRAQNVTLTQAGRDAAARFAPLLADTLNDLLGESFEEGELDELVRLLDKVTQSAREIVARDQTAPRP